MDKVLITYASKYGATREIAEHIANIMQQNGFASDVMPVSSVNDVKTYRAVILGSGVYMGLWRREAAAFLKKHAHTLAGKKVWLFSSGPTGEGSPLDLLKGWTFPKNLQTIADIIKPIDYGLFGGSMDTEKMGWFHKWIVRNIKAPVGDYRNWDSVTAWATDVATYLNK